MFKGREVRFDLLGRAIHSQSEMTKRIKDSIANHYGITPNIGGNDWSRYYRPDGAKITKTLTAILRKNLDKKAVDAVFPRFAKEISSLYHPTYKVRAFFGNKEDMGSGKYEGGSTCVAAGHTNHCSKKLVIAWKRTQMLCLSNGERGKARCIAYFPGGRNVFLTNFYYNGFEHNRLIFIEAIRRMFNLEKVIWKVDEMVFLPIYRNSDCIHVYPPRHGDHLKMPRRKIPCPFCGKKIPEKDAYYAESGASRYVGCDETHARRASETIVECCMCHEQFARGETHPWGNGRICGPCFEKTFTCVYCNRRFDRSIAIKTEDNYLYCPECEKANRPNKCVCCGKVYAGSLHPLSERQKDGSHLRACYPCFQNGNVKTCALCGGTFSFNLQPVTWRDENGKRAKKKVCDNCFRAIAKRSRASEEDEVEIEVEMAEKESASNQKPRLTYADYWMVDRGTSGSSSTGQ